MRPGAAAMGARSGAALRRIVVVLGALVLAVGLAEFGARFYLGDGFVQGAYRGPPQRVAGRFDPDLGWANRPDTRVRIAAPGFSYGVSINSKGLRGAERAYEKPEGVRRVLVLGDSTAWGWGVDDERCFAHLVDVELGADVEVVNLGVPGYSTDQELWAFEKEGVRYEPDVVVLAFVLNDLVGNSVPEIHHMQKPFYGRDEAGAWVLRNHPVAAPEGASELSGRRVLREFGMHFALAKLLEGPVPEHVPLALENPAIRERIRREFDKLVDPNTSTHMLLALLKARCDEAGAELVSFVLPHLHDRYLYEPDWPLPDELAPPSVGESFRTHGTARLAEAGAALGFRTFSVDQALLQASRAGTNLDCGDEHLNAEGNRIVAEVLAATLRPILAAR